MPSDDITKTSNVAQKNAKAAKTLADASKKMGESLNANVKAAQQFDRLSQNIKESQEGILAAMKAQGKAIAGATKNFFDFSNQINAAGGAVSGYIDKLQRMSLITSVYERKLDAMRKGQLAYSGAIQATTDAMGKASKVSQEYVNAIHDSFAGAHKIAGEFALEYEEVRRVTENLSKAFSSQLIAMGDVRSNLQNMTREAVIMSRYLGTDATTVIEMWSQRMAQSNKTLNQSRQELMLVAREADLYAQSIKKLGDDMLKTAHIGKQELIKMVQDVGKQLRTGIFDAAAYSKALRNVLVAGERVTKFTKEEQITQASALANIMRDIQSMRGGMQAFGRMATRDILERAQREGGVGFIRDKAVRERAEAVIKRTGGRPDDYVALTEMMGALRGSALLMRASLNKMRLLDRRALTTILGEQYTEGNLFLASNIAERVSTGAIQKDLSSYMEKSEKAKEEQAELWKKSVDDLIKAGATPTDIDYKMLKLVEEIKNKLAELVKSNPYLTMGIQLGTSLLGGLLGGRLLKGLAGRLLGGSVFRGAGGGLLGRFGLGGRLGTLGAGNLLGGGGGAAAGTLGSLAAWTLGPAAAGLAGWGAGRLFDVYGGRYISNMMGTEARRALGTDTSVSNMLSMAFSPSSVASLYGHGVFRMDAATYEKKKKLLDQYDREINILKKHADSLSESQKEELKLLEAKKRTLLAETEYRRKKEKEAQEAAVKEDVITRRASILAGARELTKDMSIGEKTEKMLEASFRSSDAVDPLRYLRTMKSILSDKEKLQAYGINTESIGDIDELMRMLRSKLLRRVLTQQYYSDTASGEFKRKMASFGESKDWGMYVNRMSDKEVEQYLHMANIRGFGSVSVPSLRGSSGRDFAQAATPKGNLNISVSSADGEASLEENSRNQITIKSPQRIILSGDGLARSLFGFLSDMKETAAID